MYATFSESAEYKHTETPTILRCVHLRMDSMGKDGESTQSTMIVRKRRLSEALSGTGATKIAEAFIPPPAAFAGMPPSFIGARSDIFLSGAYTRPLDPFIYHSLHYPYYKMANSKGSSFESDSSVLKKPRTVFTPKQLLHLEEEFVKNPFPNMEQRKLIAKDLDLTQQHIQIWFQNRRAKNRRKKKRHSEEEKMRCDPEPPPFWPSNLPFSSNIGDISKRNSSGETAADRDGMQVVTSDANDGRKTPHDIKQITEHPTNQTDSHPPSYTLPCTSNNTTATRPSNLHCTSKDASLNSPALTPGNGHPQIPTPPTPYNMSPVTSHPNYAGSPIVSMMNHASPVLTPPGDLALQNYPPLPPPESLLSCNFDDIPSYSSSSMINPMCDGGSLHSHHSLSAHARSILPLPIPPPPYPFSSSLTSCNIVLSSQISYSMDHHIHTPLPPSSNNTPVDFISPLTLSMNPHSKPLLPVSSEISSIVGGGPISPTISPITNSDCSLADASPLTQQDSMALPTPPSTLQMKRNFPSASSTASHPDNLTLPNEATSLNTSFSSLQRVSSPINATDLQEKDWELFSNSLCPVIQTHHDMWGAPDTQILPSDSVTRNKAVANTSITTAGTSSSSQQYSAVYGVEFSPSYNPEVSNNQSFTISSVTNGAKQ